MANFIEINSFDAPELDVYARLTENQLLCRMHPENAMFIAESPLVIERALDAGCTPLSFLMETKHAEGKAKELVARLYDYYVAHPDELPGVYHDELETEEVGRCVCDFVAGMTDRYAIETYRRLFIPEVWRGLN